MSGSWTGAGWGGGTLGSVSACWGSDGRPWGGWVVVMLEAYRSQLQEMAIVTSAATALTMATEKKRPFQVPTLRL